MKHHMTCMNMKRLRDYKRELILRVLLFIGSEQARLVMERTKHTLLVGDSATRFALEMGKHRRLLKTLTLSLTLTPTRTPPPQNSSTHDTRTLTRASARRAHSPNQSAASTLRGGR